MNKDKNGTRYSNIKAINVQNLFTTIVNQLKVKYVWLAVWLYIGNNGDEDGKTDIYICLLPASAHGVA